MSNDGEKQKYESNTEEIENINEMLDENSSIIAIERKNYNNKNYDCFIERIEAIETQILTIYEIIKDLKNDK